MRHIAAAEAKNRFGYLLDMAQHEPVTIEKKGRPVVVVISKEDYAHLEELEDQLWALKAMGAEKEGLASIEESQKFLNEEE